MADGREYELKFDIGPHDMAQLRAALGQPTGSRQLVSTYFDTEDGFLRGRNVALRIRNSSEGRVQTLKRTGASIVDREEWEHDTQLPSPDIGWLRGTPLKRLFKRRSARELTPRFTVDVHRSLFMLSHNGAQVEGALDCGVIIADGRSIAVHEFELELKSGKPKAVLALARRMAADVPLALSLASKSERGYAIAAGTWGAPTKAMSLRLHAGMTRAEAFQAIVQSCLHLFLVNAALLDSQDQTRDRGHVEAVHTARVALRRLRAALQLFGPALRRRWRKTLRTEVKWMSDKLGAARDADVFLAEVMASVASEMDQGGHDLLDLLNVRRKSARTKLRRALASSRWRTLCLDLVEASKTGLRRDQRGKRFRPFAARRFKTRLRALADRSRGLENQSEEDRHEVRKAAKMLRYGLDFLADTPGLVPRRSRFLRLRDDLQAVQQALGAIHDRAALRVYLQDLAGSDGPPDTDSLAIAAAHRITTRDSGETSALRKASKAARRVRQSNAF